MPSLSDNRFKLTSPIILDIVIISLFMISISVLATSVYDIIHQDFFDVTVFFTNDTFIVFLIYVPLCIISSISLIIPKRIQFNESTLNIKDFPRSKKLKWTDIYEIEIQSSDMYALGKMTWRGYYSSENLITIISSKGMYYANLKNEHDIARIINTLDNLGISHTEK